MVCQYGMSDAIGPISLGDDGGDVFLGRDFVTRKEYSEQKAQEIDAEITRILTTAYDEAKRLLTDHRDVLDRISLALLERETLEGSELQLLIEGQELPPLPAPEAPSKKHDVPPERPKREPEPIAGEKLPEPEPVPG